MGFGLASCALFHCQPNTCRFALACNQSSKIIEPIQSRCAIVRFTKLGEKEILERLLFVAQEEKARSSCPLAILAGWPCTLLSAPAEQLETATSAY